MGSSNANLSRLKARRKFWLEVHLWLGLAAGATLVIFGITGSLLVFHQEIDELLNPKLLTVTPEPEGPAAYRPLEEIFAAADSRFPAPAKLSFADYPRYDDGVFRMKFVVPAVPAGASELWEVGVDPYDARVTGTRLMNRSDSVIPKTFIGFIFELHYAFFMGEDWGYAITGILGAVLTISVLTGLILWWPLTGKWRQALSFKRKASPERFIFDLHKTSGFYTAVVMLPVLFSGIFMNLPERILPVVELFSPATYRYGFRSAPNPNPDAQPISIARAVEIMNGRFPSGRPDWIYGAVEADSAYMVCKHDVDAQGSLLSRRCASIDRYSGRFLDIDDPARGTAGEVFVQWQWPLHSGHAFGWTGRILVFLTGIAGPVLFVTGLLRWLQKRRARKERAPVSSAFSVQ